MNIRSNDLWQQDARHRLEALLVGTSKRALVFVMALAIVSGIPSCLVVALAFLLAIPALQKYYTKARSK